MSMFVCLCLYTSFCACVFSYDESHFLCQSRLPQHGRESIRTVYHGEPLFAIYCLLFVVVVDDDDDVSTTGA